MKNTITASFQAKICWKRLRKRENKNSRFVSFRSYPTRNRNVQKKSQKIQKIQKIPFWLHFRPKFVGKCREREKIKIIIPFSLNLTHKRKLQKNSKKIQKVKKYHKASFQDKLGWKRPRKRENKIIVPFRSFSKGKRKFPKNSKNIQKIKKKTIMASFHGKIGWQG